MSADNWTECPRCVKLDAVRYEEEKQRVRDAYGCIDSEEWMGMVQALDAFKPNGNENLREDYEIGIRNGRFDIYYKAKCDRCGFKHSFTAEEDIDMEGDSP